MINSFMSMETTTRGLNLQQLEQQVTANNLAQPYLDSNGYLMNSLQQLNVVEGAPLLLDNFGTPGGVLGIGTGPISQQITRLRNSFLDGQIQVESSVLGQAEIMTNTLSQVNGIINGSSGTLDTALTTFATAWANLSVNPLNTGLRVSVVQAGVAFATMAHSQFTQLEAMQDGLNDQVNDTVANINQILQQLASLNTQILGSQGANVNNLLDARDYALDRLSRLVNIQASFGIDGTVSVYLNGLALVDSAGAAIMQTNLQNAHNPDLVDVSVQSPEGTTTLPDATALITGGNLAGELQARDITVQGYKTQIDQITTAVMNVTNIYHEAGYAADGITTGLPFFTGTGAEDINVSGSLVGDPTAAFLAASSRVGVTTNGQIAQFLGDIRSLLANNYVVSFPAINSGAPVDPTMTIAAEAANFATPPAGGGSFTVNGNVVVWNAATDTLYSILDSINATSPNIRAVFNYTSQQIYILSNNPVNIIDTVGNFTQFAHISNALSSTIRMNNGFAPTDPKIAFFQPMNNALNTQAFRVTPAVGGSFTLDGVVLNFTNTQSLNAILATINGAAYPGTTINAFFNSATQAVTIYSFSPAQPKPITLLDKTGNFTVFTGLDGNTPVGDLSSGVLDQISTQLSSQQLAQNQASAALTQLNNAQANIGAVSTSSGQPGVPIQVIQQQAMQSLIAFNAQLQVLQIIDQMFADLVSIVGPSASGSVFQQRTV